MKFRIKCQINNTKEILNGMYRYTVMMIDKLVVYTPTELMKLCNQCHTEQHSNLTTYLIQARFNNESETHLTRSYMTVYYFHL